MGYICEDCLKKHDVSFKELEEEEIEGMVCYADGCNVINSTSHKKVFGIYLDKDEVQKIKLCN